MDLNLQAKILKAIEEQKITRVGDYEPRPVNVRVIAAANIDPLQLVRNGILREDLYYRLRVVQIDMPDLKARKEDIMLLTEHFIRENNRRMDRHILGVDDSVKDFFLRYDWPGNVRELANTIEGAFNFAKDTLLHLEDIPWISCRPLKEILQGYERNLILRSMEEHSTMQNLLAALHISRQNLNHKMKQYGIENKFDSLKKF